MGCIGVALAACTGAACAVGGSGVAQASFEPQASALEKDANAGAAGIEFGALLMFVEALGEAGEERLNALLEV